MKNYIFGYGSLMEKESRLRTTPNAINIYPVKIYSYVRGWWAKGSSIGLSTTFLGCVPSKLLKEKDIIHNFVNGVVYEVSQEELQVTDRREASYQRVKIPFDQIEDYSNVLKKESNIWAYVNEDIDLYSTLPSKKFPIVQSYVDICINGCIEIENSFPHAKEKGFASEFIKSTLFWSEYWVNDRIFPRRAFIHRPSAYKIDKLLLEHLEDPSLLEKIYFE